MNSITTVFIGSGCHNDVVLSDRGVSRDHAEVTIASHHCYFIDHNSTNGSFVLDDSGQWQRMISRLLRLDDHIKLAACSFKLSDLLRESK